MDIITKRNNYKELSSESRVNISDDKIMIFRTRKSNGMLVSNASIHTLSDGYFTHILCTDYNKNIIRTKPSRVTEKVILAQHQSLDFDSYIKDAKQFYSIED